MFRSKSWFGGGLWKPKNPHSLDQLKYLYNVLSKNQTVSESNRGLLVETLRSIAEILIWGDQNDSSVFDFFLEKNMLSFFLKIMKQKCGSYVCVQLLQTLNILFENIRNETSLYYLLSNNHVNSIIVHKFDFSDEEVMAYYISFLKTLSLKLNGHTIHFFYNEHTNDFPLYTEAIKFFNHSESMVRIAVRTLTLNVYRVEDKSMLRFIRDRTAAPYFSNLVWFIGNHVLELDCCVRNDADHQSKHRLANLVAEHLDHLHYLNDILSLNIADLNQVLTDHLLNKLLVPLYVFSLDKQLSSKESQRPHVSSVVSLFLLSQVFLILTHRPLVDTLAKIILHVDRHVFSDLTATDKIVLLQQGKASVIRPGFVPPTETLEMSLESSLESPNNKSKSASPGGKVSSASARSEPKQGSVEEAGACANIDEVHLNITDEEKYFLKALECQGDENVPNCPCVDTSSEAGSDCAVLLTPSGPVLIAQPLTKQPFIDFVYQALNCVENDYASLFALCLLFALGHNKGVGKALVHGILFPCYKPDVPCSPKLGRYNSGLVDRLLNIINLSCQPTCRVRLVTLELALRLLSQVCSHSDTVYLSAEHLTMVMEAKKESTALLRNFYKSEEILLDMFEDEYYELKRRPLNVERLTMDASVLLPPTGTPLTGIEFGKRLPSGEGERARRAVRVFLLVRNLVTSFGLEKERYLPLTDPSTYVQVDDALDLNNSDMIACTVIMKDGTKLTRQFLVIDPVQIILVESAKRIGWAVAKFAGVLQDIEVTCDKEDSRSLHIVIHRPPSASSGNRVPLLSAQFIFDDHIRCIAAKQRLTRGRTKARQRKMQQIARLLEIQDWSQPPSGSPPSYNLLTARKQELPFQIFIPPPPPPLPPPLPSQRRRRIRRSWSSEEYNRARQFKYLPTPSLRDSFTYCCSSSSNTRIVPYVIKTSKPNPYKIPASSGVRTAGLRDIPLLKTAKVPGYATALRRESLPSSRNSNSPERARTRDGSRSRDSSPKTLRPKSEEIPLKDIQKPKESSSGRPSAGVATQWVTGPQEYLSNPTNSSTTAVSDSQGSTPPVLCDVGPSGSGLSGLSLISENEQQMILSEETSFTRRTPTHASSQSRRRGQVETV